VHPEPDYLVNHRALGYENRDLPPFVEAILVPNVNQHRSPETSRYHPFGRGESFGNEDPLFPFEAFTEGNIVKVSKQVNS
jgi:hypothetical protein